jgi:hypothetical protein
MLYVTLKVAHVAQWLERQAQRYDDPCVGVRFPCPKDASYQIWKELE